MCPMMSVMFAGYLLSAKWEKQRSLTNLSATLNYSEPCIEMHGAMHLRIPFFVIPSEIWSLDGMKRKTYSTATDYYNLRPTYKRINEKKHIILSLHILTTPNSAITNIKEEWQQ